MGRADHEPAVTAGQAWRQGRHDGRHGRDQARRPGRRRSPRAAHGLSAARRPAAADIVFYGAERRDLLDRVVELKRWLKPNGALWVIRPKGSAGDHRIRSHERRANRAGLVDVKVVSFSPTHTAEKFVDPAQRISQKLSSVKSGTAHANEMEYERIE